MSKNKKQKYSWDKPVEEMWKAFEAVISKETRRGKIIIHAAMIEDFLSRLILAYLADNAGTGKLFEGFNSPLGHFSGKIHMAFALGLINKDEYGALNLLREMRNHAAHQMTEPLDERSFVDRLTTLHKRIHANDVPYIEKLYYMTLIGYLGAALHNRISQIGEEDGQQPRLGGQRWKKTRVLVPTNSDSANG